MEVSSEKVWIQKIKEVLPEFNPDKKIMVMRDFVRAPIFDYQILYNMLINELKKTSAVASSSSEDHHHHRHQQQNNNSSVVGVKLMHKSTLIRFKMRSIPPVHTLPAPETNNVVKNQEPRSSKSDLDDYFDDDQHEKIKAAATTLSSLDKNQKPILGNHLMIGPEFSKPDLGNHQQDKTKSSSVPSRSPDKNNVRKNQKPITGNHQKITPKRQRIDLHGCYDLDEEEKARAKKKNQQKNKTRSVVIGSFVSDTMPPQELEQVMNRVQGCDPLLVIQKSLYQSDVKPNLARLSLPASQVNPRFLTEEEDNKLSKNNTIEAKMYEPCGEQCVVTLTKWNMTNSATYNLIKTWNDIVRRNCLVEKTMVQLWSFRVGGQLCLFLAKL